jgi:hypothetical protein
MNFEQLIQQPESRRGDEWERNFLQQFSTIKVVVESESPKMGPDGWPYLFVRTAPDAKEPVTQVVGWLAGRGIGLVVNAHKMVPDYVFPYGMLWYFAETGRWLEAEAAGRSGDAIYDKGVLTGPPSEKYLPPTARGVLREFLRAQGFEQPRALVVTSPDFKSVDLLISQESLGDLPRSEHQALAERLSWFLPLHYTLVLGSEKGLPSFHPL